MNDEAGQGLFEAAFAVPPIGEQERMLEAVLFASREPLSMRALEERLPRGCDVGEALVGLGRKYEGRGVQLARVGDAWAFRTAADLGFLMSREVEETRKLSRAAIETLAIVAYHQPVTRAEIEEIRGVSVSAGTLDQLMEMGWVKLGRRRMTPGRPMTFVVTQGFLDHFGLGSERDLPGIAELRAAGLLDNRPSPETPPSEDAPEGQGELLD
ncbi:segregation and condensation protein B [Amaricoccus macauensis]|uniref:Segregation and condensation protein B n=1 Tax=Amaricoccus macauensis TaxID=57001 RepID=A0A840SJN6_9RHOB|nr:SMC-Scp complex subunit ScpB [Amaricoccus macauensis]MBB5223329.1 segregation and condensation protein B [Amaricoccus macauensis]